MYFWLKVGVGGGKFAGTGFVCVHVSNNLAKSTSFFFFKAEYVLSWENVMMPLLQSAEDNALGTNTPGLKLNSRPYNWAGSFKLLSPPLLLRPLRCASESNWREPLTAMFFQCITFTTLFFHAITLNMLKVSRMISLNQSLPSVQMFLWF